jgi:hypothetical protein
MKIQAMRFGVAVCALSLPLFLSGCDREVSHESTTKVNSDGSTKTEEKVVKQAPDGTVTIEKDKKVTPPVNP